MTTRLQLTLFIDEKESLPIEEIRRSFNPRQHALIKGHVTLCREDELKDLDHMLHTLEELQTPDIEIKFGLVIRFENGKGVLMPGKGNNSGYHNLRKNILQRSIDTPRRHEPHITLMHPRNSACTDEVFRKISSSRLPTSLTFRKISLIKQTNGGVWNVLKEFELG